MTKNLQLDQSLKRIVIKEGEDGVSMAMPLPSTTSMARGFIAAPSNDYDDELTLADISGNTVTILGVEDAEALESFLGIFLARVRTRDAGTIPEGAKVGAMSDAEIEALERDRSQRS
jgi:hypothetical protein